MHRTNSVFYRVSLQKLHNWVESVFYQTPYTWILELDKVCENTLKHSYDNTTVLYISLKVQIFSFWIVYFDKSARTFETHKSCWMLFFQSQQKSDIHTFVYLNKVPDRMSLAAVLWRYKYPAVNGVRIVSPHRVPVPSRESTPTPLHSPLWQNPFSLSQEL